MKSQTNPILTALIAACALRAGITGTMLLFKFTGAQ